MDFLTTLQLWYPVISSSWCIWRISMATTFHTQKYVSWCAPFCWLCQIVCSILFDLFLWMASTYDIMKLNQGKLFLIGERYKSSDAMDRAKIVVSEHTWGGESMPFTFWKEYICWAFIWCKNRAKVVDFTPSTGSDRRLFLSSQMSMSSSKGQFWTKS